MEVLLLLFLGLFLGEENFLYRLLDCDTISSDRKMQIQMNSFGKE